jgi:hypothetical protein
MKKNGDSGYYLYLIGSYATTAAMRASRKFWIKY